MDRVKKSLVILICIVTLQVVFKLKVIFHFVGIGQISMIVNKKYYDNGNYCKGGRVFVKNPPSKELSNKMAPPLPS